MSNPDVTPNSDSQRSPGGQSDGQSDGQSGSARIERRQLWRDIWLLINRANVALQLLGGALLVRLVDLEFMLRVRLGWWFGPPNQPPTQPWPLWLMLAISAGMTLGMTLLRLALATRVSTRASIGAYLPPIFVAQSRSPRPWHVRGGRFAPESAPLPPGAPCLTLCL